MPVDEPVLQADRRDAAPAALEHDRPAPPSGFRVGDDDTRPARVERRRRFVHRARRPWPLQEGDARELLSDDRPAVAVADDRSGAQVGARPERAAHPMALAPHALAMPTAWRAAHRPRCAVRCPARDHRAGDATIGGRESWTPGPHSHTPALHRPACARARRGRDRCRPRRCRRRNRPARRRGGRTRRLSRASCWARRRERGGVTRARRR